MYTYVIIDDEPLIRRGTKKKLEPLSHLLTCCGEASDGREGLELVRQLKPDIVILDMQMPVMDGCESTLAIRALPRSDAAKVRIIAMTANVMQEDVDKALAAGMDAHTGKPIDMQALLASMSGDAGGQGNEDAPGGGAA